MSNTQYKTGFADGEVAEQPPSIYEMSQKDREYGLGFVSGYAFAESVRHASKYAAATIAGELARKFSLPYERAVEEFIDEGLKDDFDSSYFESEGNAN